MSYGLVLPVHAGAMAAALLAFVLAELMLLMARRGQRRPAEAALLAGEAGNLLAGVGVLGGVTLLVVGGWPLRTPWLLASLALIAALMTVQRRFVRPWEAQVRTVLKTEPSAAAITALARARPALVGRVAVIGLFVAVAGLMTTKPDLPHW
jgi:hypothetical protein